MGEYEYYEFRALDRPLKDAEFDRVRALVPRHARVTARRVLDECDVGEFGCDPAVLLERHFDAHLFCANAGTRVLMLRLPVDRFDLAAAGRYAYIDSGPCGGRGGRPEAFAIRQVGVHAVVTWRSDDAGDPWAEDTPVSLTRLARIRAELGLGDLRPLYLGWLASLGTGLDPRFGHDRGWCEPPVPAGLRALTHAQRGLVDFLRLDPDLVAAAGACDVRA